MLELIEKEKAILEELDLGTLQQAYQQGYVDGLIEMYKLIGG